jgi:hypothetical protein
LAGLIDAEGHYTGNEYEITQKSCILAKDIEFLCKSLGFYTTVNKDGIYYRINISGNGLDEIPVLCVRKKARKQVYDREMSLLNFTIQEVGKENYYGFTVDKNHKYVLGNFIVSHNSTMSSLVYAELKMMNKSVEIVPEVAKWLIYRGEFEKLNDQYYVSSEQYKMIKALEGKVEYVIGDSGIFTGMYYNRAYKSNMSDRSKTEKMIWERNNEFSNIYVFIERNPEYPFEKEGRVHTEEESKVVDIELKEMLKEFNIPYKSVLSHRKSVKEIVDYILGFT